VKQNPTSQQIFTKAQEVLPGGSTRTVLFYHPYPFYASRGKGSRIWDVDDNERTDFCFNYSVLLLGHDHPSVRNAIQTQLGNGTSLGAPTELEVKLAERILQRFTSADRVRFVSTGTEAVMNAVRLARAHTKKDLIVKFEGAFHGTYDDVWISVNPGLAAAGSEDQPTSVPECAGLPRSVLDNCMVLPFNNSQAFENAIRKRGNDMAAVLVEPVLGVAGAVPTKADFLRTVRELTAKRGIPLILDEIVTGFRLAPGGAQQLFNVKPDITTFGKVVGGGLPIGGVASTDEIMKPYEMPEGRKPEIPLSGTFNAHPLSMAAGLAVLDELKPDAYDKLNLLGQRVRSGLKKSLADHRVSAQVTGVGSLFHVLFTKQDVFDYRSAATGDKKLLHLFDLALLNRGIYLPHLHWGNVSLATSQDDVDHFVAAAGEAAEEASSELGSSRV